MKNFKILNACLLIATFVFRISSASSQDVASQKNTMMKDCITLENGQMMMVKNGKMSPIDKEMTLKNGTKISKNGTITKKDGSSMMMKEGDCLNMKGEIVGQNEMMKDCMKMKNGAMMMMKNGKEMPMEKEMTLTNGTKIMKDGTVMKKNGTKTMMKEGECINMKGEIMMAE